MEPNLIGRGWLAWPRRIDLALPDLTLNTGPLNPVQPVTTVESTCIHRISRRRPRGVRRGYALGDHSSERRGRPVQ